ncbi:hypothetical protein P691DRAFT_806433 [Macrolepiota fuliginosa MF-IS2]|uniref:Uncharacterized protein n=1 Tax=Macrolepiota fuliginosa MF-IS2 TaxID=1400762 RepID=A0A9P6C108_9AGAR|nr:hypothetical protein P691DRAFT_806433 [Macrolepiota fuliginosa MF-IS2]
MGKSRSQQAFTRVTTSPPLLLQGRSYDERWYTQRPYETAGRLEIMAKSPSEPLISPQSR